MTIQEYNDIYKNPIVKKMMITSSGGMTITNTNIVSEQMTVEDALCSDSNLKYGACESACFKIRIADMNHNFEGEWLDVYQNLITDDDGYLMLEDGGYLLLETGYRLQLESPADAQAHIGKFKVLSDKPTNDRRWRDLTCYDAMRDIINADVSEWYAGLTFPKTIKQLRDSLFQFLEITQETTTLINDSFVVTEGFANESTLSGRDVITSICELNGVFGHIDRDGVFVYISLPSAETITLDYYVDGSGTYEDYDCDKITGITAKSISDSEIGTTVGTDGNIYQITGNLMIVGQEGTQELSTALTTLLNAIKDNQYRPFTVKTYGNPMLEVGTSVVVETRNQTINSFVMSKVMTGIQNLKDDLSAKGNKDYPVDANSLTKAINNVGVAVNGVKSEIKKTNDEIVMKVDANGNIVKVALGASAETGTTFKVGADNIELTASEVINLMSDGDINLTAKDITITSTGFSVDKNGAITSTSGTIGGFNIGATSIYKTNGTNDEVYIGNDGIRIGGFSCSSAGIVEVTGTYSRITINVPQGTSGATGFHVSDGTYTGVLDEGFLNVKRRNLYDLSYWASNGTLEMSYGSATIIPFKVTYGSSGYSASAVAFTNLSSRKVKENIEDMTEEDAKKILELNPVSFDYITGLTDQRGLIAEDVAEIIPHCVIYPNGTTKETYVYDEEKPTEVPGIDYTKFVPYLIKMVQMQQREIDELKGAK